MSFRTLVAINGRVILRHPPPSHLPRCVPFAAVRWNSSTASEWATRAPNFLLLKSRIKPMLESLADPTTEKLSYTEKLAKLREGFRDNSDLQSTAITLQSIPTVVTVECVREYVSKFGTVVECHPSRQGLFQVKFSTHEEAKKAFETINSATEYPIDVGFEYNIKLPLVADYAPPTSVAKAGKPSRTIMVRMYSGETQAVADAFGKHGTVVSSDRAVAHYHGVDISNIFVAFEGVQDAKEVFSALDGKVTINGHQYDFVYARERSDSPNLRAAPWAKRSEHPRAKRNEYPRARMNDYSGSRRNDYSGAKRNDYSGARRNDYSRANRDE